MIQRAISADKATLKDVQRQFETWRNTRESRGFIPEALWEAAVSLSGDYAIDRISRVLRLNYKELKKRVEARNKKISGREITNQFVEVDMGELFMGVECLVEMEDEKGAKMRMHIKGRVDVERLAQAFWEKRR